MFILIIHFQIINVQSKQGQCNELAFSSTRQKYSRGPERVESRWTVCPSLSVSLLLITSRKGTSFTFRCCTKYSKIHMVHRQDINSQSCEHAKSPSFLKILEHNPNFTATLFLSVFPAYLQIQRFYIVGRKINSKSWGALDRVPKKKVFAFAFAFLSSNSWLVCLFR